MATRNDSLIYSARRAPKREALIADGALHMCDAPNWSSSCVGRPRSVSFGGARISLRHHIGTSGACVVTLRERL